MAKGKIQMTQVRIFIILLTFLFVGSFATAISFYARGYRLDFKSLKVLPNGILVIKSDPDGASVFINGDLEAATNTNIPLPSGTYDVEIKKEGFLPWKKRLIIEKEIVTNVTASLFRLVPSFSPLTFDGVENPVPSSEFSKVAFASAKGLWVMETVNLPIGFAKEPRQLTDGNLDGASWEFSPDTAQILLTTQTGVFLIDTNSFTPQGQRVNVASQKKAILAEWSEEKAKRLEAQTRGLPPTLADILTRKAKSVVFSPDENMILYTASASGELPNELIRPVPGSSTQPQERTIKEGHIYLYDIKEDRNFLIGEELEGKTVSWFPTSHHLVLAEPGRVVIMDYDGTNRQIVHSGSYVSPFAFPFASTSRLLILTNLGADSSSPNLYSLTIK